MSLEEVIYSYLTLGFRLTLPRLRVHTMMVVFLNPNNENNDERSIGLT